MEVHEVLQHAFVPCVNLSCSSWKLLGKRTSPPEFAGSDFAENMSGSHYAVKSEQSISRQLTHSAYQESTLETWCALSVLDERVGCEAPPLPCFICLHFIRWIFVGKPIPVLIRWVWVLVRQMLEEPEEVCSAAAMALAFQAGRHVQVYFAAAPMSSENSNKC